MVTSFLVLMTSVLAYSTDQAFNFFDLRPTNDGAILLTSSETGLKLCLIVEKPHGTPLIGEPIEVKLGGIPPTRTIQTATGPAKDPILRLLGLADFALIFDTTEKQLLFLNIETGELDTSRNNRIIPPSMISKAASFGDAWLFWGNHFIGSGPGLCGKKAFHVFDSAFKETGCFGTGMDAKESFLKGDLSTIAWSPTTNTGYIFYPKSEQLFIVSPDGATKNVATTYSRPLAGFQNIHCQKNSLLMMETGAGSAELFLLDDNYHWQLLDSWKGDWVRALPLERHVLLVRPNGKIDSESYSKD